MIDGQGDSEEPSSDVLQQAERRRGSRRVAAVVAGLGALQLIAVLTVVFVGHDRGAVLAAEISPTVSAIPTVSVIPTGSASPSASARPTVSPSPSASRTVAPPPSTAAPCTTAQLRVSGPVLTEWAGGYGQLFEITNAGSRPCGLPRWVTNVHGTTSTGRHMVLSKLGRGGRDLNYPVKVPTLAPGGRAWFSFSEADPGSCGLLQAKVTITTVTFSIGPKATFTEDLTRDPGRPDPISLGCETPGVGEFGAPRSLATKIPLDVNSPENNIETSLSAPAQVAAGQRFDYTVTVSNDNSYDALSLSPCPHYFAIWYGMYKHPVMRKLDCRGQKSLPGDHSISFHLSLRAPAQTGTMSLVWGVEELRSGLADVGAGATIVVTK